MTAFDSDVLTEILLGTPEFVQRLKSVAPEDQAVPVIVVEEILRGRLNTIRQAEAGKSRISLDVAYALFARTFTDFQSLRILPYPAEADDLVKAWRKAKVRGSTHDLRIAASCVCAEATLVTRNRRDFERVPGLTVELWT